MLHLLRLQEQIAATERQVINGAVWSPTTIELTPEAIRVRNLEKLQAYRRLDKLHCYKLLLTTQQVSLLLQAKQIFELPRPDTEQLSTMQHVFIGTTQQPRYPSSKDLHEAWLLHEDSTGTDLVTLAMTREDDFSKWFRPSVPVVQRVYWFSVRSMLPMRKLTLTPRRSIASTSYPLLCAAISASATSMACSGDSGVYKCGGRLSTRPNRPRMKFLVS